MWNKHGLRQPARRNSSREAVAACPEALLQSTTTLTPHHPVLPERLSSWQAGVAAWVNRSYFLLGSLPLCLPPDTCAWLAPICGKKGIPTLLLSQLVPKFCSNPQLHRRLTAPCCRSARPLRSCYLGEQELLPAWITAAMPLCLLPDLTPRLLTPLQQASRPGARCR